jgi:CheY-like chemotaxis protein
MSFLNDGSGEPLHWLVGTGDFSLSQPLAGLRILVIEDEFLIAMDVEQLCYDNGASHVAIVSRMQPPHQLPDCDIAILDLVLSGISTMPLAEHFHRRGVPFVFVSGYQDRAELAARFPGTPLLPKPYVPEDLLAAVAGLSAKAQRG